MTPRRPSRWLLAAALVAATASGCLVDVDDKCGENQELRGTDCFCVDGFGLVDGVCVACGENEVGSMAGCACLPGFDRPSPDAACEEQLSVGAPCASDDDCDAAAPHCELPDGYCTETGCDTFEDCAGYDYGCDTARAPTVCVRPPEGHGTACASDADCPDDGASYCETLSADLCLKSGCDSAPGEICWGDWQCCSVGLLGQAICVPPSDVDGASCVGGLGSVVPKGVAR